MNKPEHIIVKAFGTVVAAAKTELALTVLNYQYGYVRDVNAILQSWGKTKAGATAKYPMVYLVQPFTVKRGSTGDFYGETSLRWLVITQNTDTGMSAEDRMTNIFELILYPIYREVLRQLGLSGIFTSAGDTLTIEHAVTDRYWWGEDQQQVLNDKVDVIDVSETRLKIYNNLNCP